MECLRSVTANRALEPPRRFGFSVLPAFLLSLWAPVPLTAESGTRKARPPRRLSSVLHIQACDLSASSTPRARVYKKQCQSPDKPHCSHRIDPDPDPDLRLDQRSFVCIPLTGDRRFLGVLHEAKARPN